MDYDDLEQRILEYVKENPISLYVHYDDSISDEAAQWLLSGEYGKFNEYVHEITSGDDEVWHLKQDIMSQFELDDWYDLPDEMQDSINDKVYEYMDQSDAIEQLVKNWNGNVVAFVKDDNGEYLYSPSYDEGNPDDPNDANERNAMLMKEKLGLPDYEEYEGTYGQKLAQKAELVYGGYDRESLVVIGKVDLYSIFQKQVAPTRVEVSPKDIDHLLFFEAFNGCGNMRTIQVSKSAIFDAEYVVDTTQTYSVDGVYGFTGSHWRDNDISTIEPRHMEEFPDYDNHYYFATFMNNHMKGSYGLVDCSNKEEAMPCISMGYLDCVVKVYINYANHEKRQDVSNDDVIVVVEKDGVELKSDAFNVETNENGRKEYIGDVLARASEHVKVVKKDLYSEYSSTRWNNN